MIQNLLTYWVALFEARNDIFYQMFSISQRDLIYVVILIFVYCVKDYLSLLKDEYKDVIDVMQGFFGVGGLILLYRIYHTATSSFLVLPNFWITCVLMFVQICDVLLQTNPNKKTLFIVAVIITIVSSLIGFIANLLWVLSYANRVLIRLLEWE